MDPIVAYKSPGDVYSPCLTLGDPERHSSDESGRKRNLLMVGSNIIFLCASGGLHFHDRGGRGARVLGQVSTSDQSHRNNILASPSPKGIRYWRICIVSSRELVSHEFLEPSTESCLSLLFLLLRDHGLPTCADQTRSSRCEPVSLATSHFAYWAAI